MVQLCLFWPLTDDGRNNDHRSSGSKPAPAEGKIAEFLASFNPSPAKANKHIILYSER